jgi:hypothetical protein
MTEASPMGKTTLPGSTPPWHFRCHRAQKPARSTHENCIFGPVASHRFDRFVPVQSSLSSRETLEFSISPGQKDPNFTKITKTSNFSVNLSDFIENHFVLNNQSNQSTFAGKCFVLLKPGNYDDLADN